MQTSAEPAGQEAIQGTCKPNRVGLLYPGELSPLDRKAMAISEFAGLEVELIPARSTADLANSARVRGLMASADTLETLLKTSADSGEFRPELHRVSPELFIFGFRGDGSHNRLLQKLTAGSITGASELPGVAGLSAPAEARDFCRQFAGLTITPADSTFDAFFAGAAGSCDTLLRAGERPFVVRHNSSEGRLTLVACADLADLEEPMAKPASLLAFFSRLGPLLMFLREAFPGFVWENSQPVACFIIDDPLLSESYGFLNYRRLLEEMAGVPFSISIAFIPFNFKRSRKTVADLFRKHSGALSLCVHGCDHTAGEFGGTDRKALELQAARALNRMISHQKRAGVSFDRVMVFPQGIFSRAAMEALGSLDYAAAINSSQFPVGETEAIPLRELLEVATHRFSSVPLFVRRYPQTLAETAFDLFLGKPALLVEHHGFFRNGFAPLREAIQTINKMDSRLTWMSPEQVCSTTTVARTLPGDTTEVRFFCDRLRFTNRLGRKRGFIFRRPAPGRIRNIAVNRESVQPLLQGGELNVHCTLDSGETAEIKVDREMMPESAEHRQTRGYHARVFVRRMLSELRDNYIDKSPSLTSARKAVRSWVGN